MNNLPNSTEIESKLVPNLSETTNKTAPFVSEEENEETKQKRGSYKAGQKLDQAVMDLADAIRDGMEIVNNPAMNTGDILRNIVRVIMKARDGVDAIKEAKALMKE